MAHIKHSYKELAEAVKHSNSYRGVILYLNHRPNTSLFKLIRREIQLYGIDITHWVHPRKGSKIPVTPARLLSDILRKNIKLNTYKLKIRLIKENILPAKCNICGIFEWQGKQLSLELHHRDGDRLNNLLENLQILCPNCHSQTPTYRGKNKKAKAPIGELVNPSDLKSEALGGSLGSSPSRGTKTDK